MADARFALILKRLRHKNDMTQKELAALLGVTTSEISAYERGDRIPSLSRMIMLADHFLVSLDYLVGREIDMREYEAGALARTIHDNPVLMQLNEHAARLSAKNLRALTDAAEGLAWEEKRIKRALI